MRRNADVGVIERSELTVRNTSKGWDHAERNLISKELELELTSEGDIIVAILGEQGLKGLSFVRCKY